MKIRQELEKSFYREWANLRYGKKRWVVELSSIERAKQEFKSREIEWETLFDFVAIETKVNDDIEEGEWVDRKVRERYHRSCLSNLSRSYALTLFKVSDFGKVINDEMIRLALQRLKVTALCPYYPCQLENE